MNDDNNSCVTKFMALVCAGTLVGTFVYAIYYLLKSW